MRYRLMATYRGSPFEAGIGPSDGDIVLFAACPPPEDLGFEPATGHWRKQVPISEVQGVWESRPVGRFRGERCMVLDDLGDRLHIGYLGHDGYQAEQLGYWQVDRGVFELVAARTEVSDLTEERTEYPRQPSRPEQPPARAATLPAGNGISAPGSLLPAAAAGPNGYLAPLSGPPPGDYFLPAATSADSADFDRPAGPDTGSYTRPAGFNSADFDRPAGPDTGSYTRPAGFESGDFTVPAGPDSGQYPSIPGGGQPGADSGPLARPVFRSVRDEITGFSLPSAAEPPLPLEAAAMRAASSRSPRPTAGQRRAPVQPAPAQPAPVQPAPVGTPAASGPTPAATKPGRAAPPTATVTSGPAGLDAAAPAGGEGMAAVAPASTPEQPASTLRPRRSARHRLATERLFAELAGLAAIPVDSYAVGEEVEGALCLLRTDQGFEVFHSADGNRHEQQFFATEESACFYLFGVLAAEAVRNGSLVPGAGQLQSARASR
jgi:hypothetical protein